MRALQTGMRKTGMRSGLRPCVQACSGSPSPCSSRDLQPVRSGLRKARLRATLRLLIT
ncbi:hypothetical protein THTE_3963 [Thermogutta terrifontis]|uniref:Uncharacterized protein n=1 Tax=Thermogutta terrifontis TaxID=1331910 RepID=A0A286RKT4_9BACT|nr:hypothetical protein THTE_3963 [Thermogutta terrifontis]